MGDNEDTRPSSSSSPLKHLASFVNSQLVALSDCLIDSLPEHNEELYTQHFLTHDDPSDGNHSSGGLRFARTMIAIKLHLRSIWKCVAESPMIPELLRLSVMILIACVAYKAGQKGAAPPPQQASDPNKDDDTVSTCPKSVEDGKGKSRKGKSKRRRLQLNFKRNKGNKAASKDSGNGRDLVSYNGASFDDGASIETGESSLETGVSSLRSGGISRGVVNNINHLEGATQRAHTDGEGKDQKGSIWRKAWGSRHGKDRRHGDGEEEPIGQEISVNQSQGKIRSDNTTNGDQHVGDLDIVIAHQDDEDYQEGDGMTRTVPLNDATSSKEEPKPKTESVEEFNKRVDGRDEEEENIPLEPKRLLGPDVQSIKFFVCTPPREDILGLFAPTKYRSIHRLLEVNVFNLTLTVHTPKVDQLDDTADASKTTATGSNDESSKVGATKSDQTVSPTDEEEEKEEKFIAGHRIPLAAIKNTHAMAPLTGGVLKLTFDIPRVFDRDAPKESNPDTLIQRAQVETTATSREGQVPLDPSYDVLQVENNFREMKRRTYIAQHSGFIEPTIVPGDKFADIAARGCTQVVQNRKKEEEHYTDTMEFTFENARDAALFQHLIMTLNSVGHQVRALYRNLETLRLYRILNGSRGEAYRVGDEDKAPDEPYEAEGPQKEMISWRELEEVMNDPQLRSAILRDPVLALLRKKGFDSSFIYKTKEDHACGCTPQNCGVALDDAYRCLSSIPFLRRRLQTFYDAHYPSRTLAEFDSGVEMIDAGYYFSQPMHRRKSKAGSSTARGSVKDSPQEVSVIAAVAEAEAKRKKNEKDGEENDIDDSQVRNFRNVLGLGDLLYLFLGMLPDDAVPFSCPAAASASIGHHFFNCKQELLTRRRVARAGHYVQNYIKAMKVVEIGWNALDRDITPLSQVKKPLEADAEGLLIRDDVLLPLDRRLAFDDNLANISHDTESYNEYYEATVGRDVRRCEFLQDLGGAELVQGFALVGVNVFRTKTGPLSPGPDAHQVPLNNSVSPSDDPVMVIDSLRALVEANPEVEFFISSFFPELSQTCVVAVFARVLPVSVDTSFESTVS
jgi:hypothetical protein